MRNGTMVYHCKRNSSDLEYDTYEKPIRYLLHPRYLTIQPNTGNAYDSTFGEYKDYQLKMCGIPYELWDNEIKEGDVFYVDIGEAYGINSDIEPELGWGYGANYKVVKVAKQNRAIYYALKSIVENSNA